MRQKGRARRDPPQLLFRLLRLHPVGQRETDDLVLQPPPQPPARVAQQRRDGLVRRAGSSNCRSEEYMEVLPVVVKVGTEADAQLGEERLEGSSPLGDTGL